MSKKFAYIDFIDEKEEIPIKNFFNFLKNGMLYKILRIYIKNKNIFLFEKKYIYDVEGYNVKVLVPKNELYDNIEYTKKVIERTIDQLQKLNVEIINIVYDFNFNFYNYFEVCSDKYIINFFILDIIKKVSKIIKKDMKNIEIVILANRGIKEDIVLELVYPNVNYLSILSSEEDKDYYREKAKEIFEDTGLNLHIIENNRSMILKEADIIINIGKDHKLDYVFKRGSVYIDLSENEEKIKELILKRDDMLFIDNIKVSFNDESFLLREIELYMYLKLREYRSFYKNWQYDINSIKIIRKYIDEMKITIRSIGVLNAWLNSILVEKFIKNLDYNIKY